MIDSARAFNSAAVNQSVRLRVIACVLVCLGPLLLIAGSRFLHAGHAGTLIGESLAALVVIAIVATLSLRNSDSALERSRGWSRAGGAYLFVCALITALGVINGGATADRTVPPPPQVTQAASTAPASERPLPVTATRVPDADQIKALVSASEERLAASQEKYRNLLSPSYFVRLLAPENLEDSEKVRQARFLLARLADSADSYASELSAEGKSFIDQIQSADLSADAKTRYLRAVQQVQSSRQEDVGRWMSAKRASIATSLGILTLVEDSDYAVVAQGESIAFVDRAAGEHYEILVEQLRAQDARARSALRAVVARDQQMRAALGLAD